MNNDESDDLRPEYHFYFSVKGVKPLIFRVGFTLRITSVGAILTTPGNF